MAPIFSSRFFSDTFDGEKAWHINVFYVCSMCVSLPLRSHQISDSADSKPGSRRHSKSDDLMRCTGKNNGKQKTRERSSKKLRLNLKYSPSVRKLQINKKKVDDTHYTRTGLRVNTAKEKMLRNMLKKYYAFPCSICP